MMQTDIADNTFWRTLTLLVKLILQIVTLVVLSRLLPVSAFGKLAYVMIFFQFAGMATRFGISAAVIQSPTLNTNFLKSAFTLSSVIGFSVCVILFFSARLFSADPTTVQMLQFVSFSFIFIGVGNVAEAKLQRDFKFKKLFFIELCSFFFGYTLLSIAMAMLDFGVWSLTAAIVAAAIMRSVLMNMATRTYYLPFWSKSDYTNLLQFGAGLTLSGFFYFTSQNIDYFVTGHLLGDESLGLYSRARQLITIPSDIINATAFTILLTTFSRLNKNKVELKTLYLTGTSTIAIPTITLAALLIVLAPELVIWLFGNDWEGTILPLQILALNAFFALYTVGDALFVSQRKIKLQIFTIGTFAVLVGIGSMVGANWGIVGIATGVMIATAICYLYVLYIGSRLLNIGFIDFINCQLPAFCMGLIVFVVGYITKATLVVFALPDWFVVVTTSLVILLTFVLVLFSSLKLYQGIRLSLLIFLKEKNPNIATRIEGIVKR